MSDYEITKIERNRRQEEIEKYNNEYIDNLYNKLMIEHGIILLPVDYNTTIEKIKDQTKEYKNMVRFVINVNGDRYIAFRYKPIEHERIDVKSILQEADEAYKSSDFKKSSELYFKLLPVFSKPSSFIYSRLGISLLKIGKRQKAVDYLILATYMAKKEEKTIDYTGLIDKIRFDTPDDDNKRVRVNMTSSDFDYWNEQNNDIELFDRVNDYILLTGQDVETASKTLGLTDEQINIINLLYAREFFIRKEAKKGEQFLKVYEESDCKTKKSKELYTEIQRTKKLYANRKPDSSKRLLLSLQPKNKNNN